MYSHKTPRPHKIQRSRQRGISIMELMIGITIGMLVVVAAMATMSVSQVSSATMTDSTRLQQTADMVFRAMGFQANQAGALALIPSGDPNKVVFSNNFAGFDSTATGGTAFLAVNGAEGSSNAPDTLRLSYENDGASRDCLGNTDASINHVDSEFTVSQGSLRCNGNLSTTGAQPIADGVDDFQVWYGTQTAAGVFQFATATNVSSWDLVQAVRICLVLRGERQGNPQPGLATTGCRNESLASDGVIRRTFWRTFTLRNKIL